VLQTTASEARGRSWERWEASAKQQGSSVSLRMRLGPWTLSGKGARDDEGLRCRMFSGSVLEGYAQQLAREQWRDAIRGASVARSPAQKAYVVLDVVACAARAILFASARST
jgi:hypothetical protein